MQKITESEIERLALEQLEAQGYEYLPGTLIAPDGEFPERDNYSQLILRARLREAIANFNPNIPPDTQEQALKEVERVGTTDLLTGNERFHRLLTEGIPVSFRTNGEERHDYVQLVDFSAPDRNRFLAVNQFTIVENGQNKRPDIILFVNGLPLVVIELKNAASEQATVRKAYQQLQTYQTTVPSLFAYNAFSVISDGHEARAGTLSANFSRFMAWKSVGGDKEVSRFQPQLSTLIQGMLNPTTLLDLVRNYLVFEKQKKIDPRTGLTQIETVKKLAAYHQYFAVEKAVASTAQASQPQGSRKGGVVWHTPGQRQVALNGVLHRQARAAARQSHHRRYHGPQRFGRSTL